MVGGAGDLVSAAVFSANGTSAAAEGFAAAGTATVVVDTSAAVAADTAEAAMAIVASCRGVICPSNGSVSIQSRFRGRAFIVGEPRSGSSTLFDSCMFASEGPPS